MNENNEMGAEGSVPMNDDFNAKLDFLNTHVTDANRESLKAYNAYRDQGLWDTATPDHQATIMAGVNDLYNAATQAPAQDAQQEFKIRMDKRYQQANDIRTKAQYVINQNGDNADLSNETQNAQAYIDFLENNNSVFDNMTDDKANTLLAGVNDLYERAKSRRGHAEKFWDSIKQGYEDTGTMNAMGLKVLKPGEMTQDDKEVLQGLNDVQNRNHILTPKGVEDIRDISSVGDFFDFALGSIGSNAARAAEAAGLGVVAAMTGGAAVPAYATAASMVGGFVGSLPQSIGEVTGGQLDEKNHDFSRAAAIGEGVGYALLDSITGVVPGLSKVWGKLVKSAGGKLTKEALLKSAQQLTKDATKRELLKEIGKEALGEALTEPAQSGIVTRTRRYIQTGTPYTEDEIATGNPLKEALWDATNEAIGGALTSLGMGAPGKIANHVHAKHTMELANNVASKVMRTEEFKQLSPEYQYLVASHIMYDAMYATQGAISTNREVEDSVRANMQARSQDIDTLLKEASSNGDKNAIAAQTLLKAFDATTNYQDVVTVMEQESAKPNGLRSLIDREAMVKNRGFFFSGDGKNIQGTVFTDDNTGIAIVHNKNGEYIVLNNKDFGDPIGAPESVKTLDEAIKLADAFSVANQVTEREEAQRMEVVKNAVEKIFGKRDITIIPTHNRDIANARNESPASYDTENNTLYLNVDGIRNFGDLYTALMHERGHQDLANQLTQATPEMRAAIEQAIANSRGVETMKGRYLGADGELTDDARTIGEELLVERSSVADVVKALNAMSQGGMTSALARVFNAVRAKMGADTGIPTGLITDADVRKELAFLNDNGYLGVSGNGAVFAEPTLMNAPNTRRIEKDVEIAESREAFKRGANAMLAEMLAPKADAVPQLGMKPQAIVTPQTEMNAWKSAKDPALALVEMIQGLVAKLKEADTLAAQRAALAGVAPQATEKMTDAEVTAVSDKLTDGTQTIEEMAKSFENLAQGEFTFTYPEVVENPAATDAQKPVDTKQKNTEKPTAPITAENAPTSASQEEDKSIPMEAADAPQGEIEASTAKEEANVAIEDKNKEVEAEKPTTKKPVKKTKKAAVKVEDEKVTETPKTEAPAQAKIKAGSQDKNTEADTESIYAKDAEAKAQKALTPKRGEKVVARLDGRVVNGVYLKDNGNGTSDIQVREPGRNRFEKGKVYNATIKNEDVKTTIVNRATKFKTASTGPAHDFLRENARKSTAEFRTAAAKHGLKFKTVRDHLAELGKEPFADGEIDKHGMESFHVVRHGDRVYKFRNAENSQDHELMNVEYFNEVFPNTAYTIEGFAESNGKIVTVLSQRYVDMDQSRGDEARKGILDDIKKRLGSAELRENEIHAGEWMVDDLKDANIGIEKSSGKPVVIDARIHKLNEMPKKLWWDGDTDRVNAIVDNSGAFDANNQDIRYKTRPNGKQKSANTAYPDASTEIRAIPSGVRYKSRNRNIVFTTADNTDYLGGAKENLRAHGIVFDELDLDPSISNEEARTRAEAVRRDAVSLNAIMERASNGTPLTDVESLALILEGRDRLINLTASRMGGNLSADENALQDAALNRVLYAVRMAGRQAGKTLQQYRRLFALDKAQDMEGYIIGEARAEMDRRGLAGDIPEDIQKRIHQMASDLNKANEALAKAQAKMVEMEEKAAADAAELELARSRKQFRLDAAIQKKVNQFFGDSTITQDDLFAIGRMEEIFGVTHNDAKHKSTSSVNSGMAQEVSDIFSHLLCKANFDMDKVAAFVDSYNNAKMTEAFTAFRQRMESGAVNTTEEEKANRVKEVAEKERETVTRRNRVRIIARKPITNRISLTLEDLERRVESARNKCVQAMEDLDGNADAQRKALGRYLRTYQRLLVAKNPELTDAEVYAKMAEEAKAVHSTGSYDATEMLYVLTGKKGFSMEQRTAMNQRVSLLKAALAEAKRGNLTKAASMAGIAYHSESDTLAEYTQKLQNTLDTATRKLADILANPLPDQQAQVDTINQLKDEIVSTKQAIDDLYKDTKMAEKRARYIAYLENRLTALNEEMDKMVREVGDVEARRARIAELNARIGELKHELTEAQKERNLMKRLERQIDEYQRRIDEQDFETPVSVKKPIEEYSKRVQVMMRERDRMRELYKKERQKFEYRKLSKLQKAGRDLMEIIGETKAIVGSFDLSAMFRQGGQLVFAHPLIFKKNFVKTLKIFKSEEYARQVMDEIKARPNFRFYEMAKIDFTDWGEGAVNAEDRYLLNKYRAMMKVKPLALGIQASERSFSMFLNLMRADCFDALVANSTFGSAQNMNKQQLLALGNFVNIASQRGAVDQDAVGKAIPFLNTILWSPRNIISRFQFLWNTAKLALPGTDPYGDKTLRGLFAKELGRYLLGVGIMIAFSKMLSDLFRPDDEPPQDIVLDPRSSDFMKVRFGNARVDVLSGLTPILVLGARLFSGTTVNSRGQEKDTNAPELVGRFLRTKLAPGVSYFWDLFVTKESFDHQEIMWSDPLVKNENEIGIIRHFGSSFTPLAAQDIVKQMEMNGASRGMITSLFTILGAGVQAYNPYTFRQLSGDYYYFRRQWLEAKDNEERRKLETLHPMLRHQGEISNQLKTCNFWKKQIRLMEKQGNTEAVKRFTEHLEKAQQITVNMMAGFPKPTKIY